MFWVLLVDCVRVSKFDHGFVFVFSCLVAKKMQEKRREENLEFIIFWATMFLGEEHEEQLLVK